MYLPNPFYWLAASITVFKLNHDWLIRTATVILPMIFSGIGEPIFFISLSKHVDMSSIQIHTSLWKAKTQGHQ